MAMAMVIATATAVAMVMGRGMAMTRAMVVATATTMAMPMVMVRLLFWVIVKATKLPKILRNLERKMLIKTTSFKKIALLLHCEGKTASGKGSNKMAANNVQNS